MDDRQPEAPRTARPDGGGRRPAVDVCCAPTATVGASAGSEFGRRRSRGAGRHQPALVQPPARPGAGRVPELDAAWAGRGPDRRRRLRRRLVDHRARHAPTRRPRGRESTSTPRRSTWHEPNAAAAGLARPGQFRSPTGRPWPSGRALRRGLRLRVPARHVATRWRCWRRSARAVRPGGVRRGDGRGGGRGVQPLRATTSSGPCTASACSSVCPTGCRPRRRPARAP